MIRKIVEVAFAIVLFILQVTVFKVLEIASISPDLMIILVVSFALMKGRREGIFLGFLCGAFVDLFFSPCLGFYALLYMIVGYVNGLFRNEFFAEDIKLPLILIASSELVLNLLVYIFMFFFRGDFAIGYYMVNLIIPTVIYTVMMSVLLYPLILFVNSKLTDKERRSASKFG